jgi:Caleosin related protein
VKNLLVRRPAALVSYNVAEKKRRARSALELHARYFDPDHDEAVTPKQTLKGMTDLGLPWLMAAPLTLVINGFLGFLTRKRASLSISVPDIARGKHPFGSGVFGKDGKLDEAAFEELFLAPNARQPRDRVTYAELRALVLKKGDPKMPFGPLGSLAARIFSAAEVYTLFCLASDCQKRIGDRVLPAMSRKNLRRFYEGRLFPLLARRRRILSVRAEL